MKSIKFEAIGTTPLMLNSTATVNPLNPLTKQIKELTSKKTKTDEDMNEIFHLKFLASLYTNKKGQYIIPSNMLLASFKAGAKENKLGKKFEESVFIFEDSILQFKDNGCTPEELWENHSEEYVDIRPVGIMKAKVIAARAIIPEWSIKGEIFYDESQLNKSQIWLAMTNAGLRKGIGTYRQLFGRYELQEIKSK